jgi:hypothetical protein
MGAFTYFSKHAYMRIAQRTLLSFDQIAFILDKGYFVNTGTEPGFNRDHLVFYSHKDETCFVAIRDHYSGKIVTILPLDYHHNLAWPISEQALNKARQIYPFNLLDEKLKEKLVIEQKESQLRIYLTFHFFSEDEKRKSKPLISVVSEQLPEKIDQVIKDVDAYSLAQQKALTLNIPWEKVSGVSARVGRRGSMEFFDLDELLTICGGIK